MTATILDGKTTARAWLSELRARTGELAAGGIVPGLAVIQVGEDPASTTYVRNKQRACAKVGIEAQVAHLPATAGQAVLADTIDRLGADGRVHGLLVQVPLPVGYDYDPVAAQERVPPAKDVDGLHPISQGLLALGRPRFVPATPLGILELLRRYGIPIAGRRAVVVGRSAIVGRPLALLLGGKGLDATVTVCHSRTRDLPDIARSAELLFVATGRPRSIGAEHVRAGSVVVDVGVNRVDAPDTERGYCLQGDVDFAAVAEVAGAITPVPGGVGPMTIAAVVHNTIAAAEQAAGCTAPAAP